MMRWDLFWDYKDTIAVKGYEGFSLFSIAHILWLVFLTAGIVAFAVFYRRGGDRARDNMRKCMALFLIFFEISKQCLISLAGEANHALPLEICSLAEYTILFDAFWPNNRFTKQLLAYAFLPASVIALLLPTVLNYPPINFYSIHQFVMHGAIAAYIIARYSSDEIRPRYAGLWLTSLTISVLMVPVYFIDKIFDENYMFLMAHRNNPALKLVWNLSGGNGGILYVLGLVALVIIVFHVMQMIFSVVNLIKKRKNKQKLPDEPKEEAPDVGDAKE